MTLGSPSVFSVRRVVIRRRDVAAFTLIELLIVVAVILILAALVAPSIANALRSSQNTECFSNLHQIHVGMMGYAVGFSRFIVPLGNFPHMVPYFRGWHHNLKPYLENMDILACPALPDSAVGYGMNYRVIGGIDELRSLYRWPQPLSKVRKPSQSFIFCDWGYVVNPDDPADDWVVGPSPLKDPVNQERSYARMPLDVLRPGSRRYYICYETDPHRPFPAHPRHITNCVFFDGHNDGFPTRDIVDDEYGEENCLYDNE